MDEEATARMNATLPYGATAWRVVREQTEGSEEKTQEYPSKSPTNTPTIEISLAYESIGRQLRVAGPFRISENRIGPIWGTVRKHEYNYKHINTRPRPLAIHHLQTSNA